MGEKPRHYMSYTIAHGLVKPLVFGERHTANGSISLELREGKNMKGDDKDRSASALRTLEPVVDLEEMHVDTMFVWTVYASIREMLEAVPCK